MKSVHVYTILQETDSSFSVSCSHLDPAQIIDCAVYICLPSSFKAVRTTVFAVTPQKTCFTSKFRVSSKFYLNYSNTTLAAWCAYSTFTL